MELGFIYALASGEEIRIDLKEKSMTKFIKQSESVIGKEIKVRWRVRKRLAGASATM